jgi:hypothetical protein
MVHDDDTARTWNMDPWDEPLEVRAPRDERTRELILKAARTHQDWGRIRICEELRASGYDVDEPEVNYVLNQYKLRNLYR